MRVGDVMRMKSCRAVFSNGEFRGSAGFKAPKGKQFVFVLLGMENADGSGPLDPTKALEALGYTRKDGQ